MTSEQSDALTKDNLPATAFTESAKWYVQKRVLPAIALAMLAVVFFAAAPPWGELDFYDLYGWLCMVVGALGYEAIQYKPWRDA